MRTTSSIIAAAFALTALNSPKPAEATTINGITISDQFFFTDDESINDVGGAGGFKFNFGAQISGGSLGYSAAGIFTPTGATTPTLTQTLSACGPTSTSPNFCGHTTAVTNPKLNGTWGSGLNGTWDFEIQSPPSPLGATATAIFPLPTTAGLSLTPLPFPSSVTITNSANGAKSDDQLDAARWLHPEWIRRFDFRSLHAAFAEWHARCDWSNHSFLKRDQLYITNDIKLWQKSYCRRQIYDSSANNNYQGWKSGGTRVGLCK